MFLMDFGLQKGDQKPWRERSFFDIVQRLLQNGFQTSFFMLLGAFFDVLGGYFQGFGLYFCSLYSPKRFPKHAKYFVWNSASFCQSRDDAVALGIAEHVSARNSDVDLALSR